ncbi:GIY-YIG nuclease family protein [Elizabethkingia meningoseptica]
MKEYYIYIIKCADNSYYRGVTENLLTRLQKHRSGYYPTSYPYNSRPVKLVYYCNFSDVNEVILFEKQAKGWSRKKKEALIDKNFEKLKELSVCTNKSHFSNYRKDKQGFMDEVRKFATCAQPDNSTESS